MLGDSTQDTLDHIAKVSVRVHEIVNKLVFRALDHDRSKLIEPEKSGYDQITEQPEHYESGIAGMTLLDIVEMLCDWKAASERTKQGSIAQSLGHNRQRFQIDDQLASILENTVKELGW
jgi:uncharacterized protein DUF5662